MLGLTQEVSITAQQLSLCAHAIVSDFKDIDRSYIQTLPRQITLRQFLINGVSNCWTLTLLARKVSAGETPLLTISVKPCSTPIGHTCEYALSPFHLCEVNDTLGESKATRSSRLLETGLVVAYSHQRRIHKNLTHKREVLHHSRMLLSRAVQIDGRCATVLKWRREEQRYSLLSIPGKHALSRVCLIPLTL